MNKEHEMKGVRSLTVGFLAALALIAVAPTPAAAQCAGEWMTDSSLDRAGGVPS